MSIPFFGRQNELTRLKDFLENPQSKFIYVQGRKEVGKTHLLKAFQSQNQNPYTRICYFEGDDFATDDVQRKRFAKMWAEATNDNTLTELKHYFLSWEAIFENITKNLNSNIRTVLIFDEVQWLCKKGVFFSERFRKQWSLWKDLNLKVIISSSSYKWFINPIGGELEFRDLATDSPIMISPFSLEEVKSNWFNQLEDAELHNLYSQIGGYPGYLTKVSQEYKGLLPVTEMFSSKHSPLTLEKEYLRLEFNEAGIKSARKILKALGGSGATEATIIKSTELGQQRTQYLMSQLINYKLVYEQRNGEKKNRSGTIYFIQDEFLKSFYQALQLHKK